MAARKKPFHWSSHDPSPAGLERDAIVAFLRREGRRIRRVAAKAASGWTDENLALYLERADAFKAAAFMVSEGAHHFPPPKPKRKRSKAQLAATIKAIKAARIKTKA